MTAPTLSLPQLVTEGSPPQLRLSGQWTLAHAQQISQALSSAPRDVAGIDASGIERLDSLGVLQLLRFSRRHDIDFGTIAFHEDHRALVSAIEDVADDRPRRKREYGVAAALA